MTKTNMNECALFFFFAKHFIQENGIIVSPMYYKDSWIKENLQKDLSLLFYNSLLVFVPQP